MNVLHVNYEFPGVTANCGGGGRVTELLDECLEERGIGSRVITDWDDGHYTTFPARSYSRVRGAIASGWPDVVHGHFSLPSSLALPRLCERHDVPLVVSVMGADVYDPTRFALVRPFADRLNRHILGRADAVVAPSTDMQRRVRESFGLSTERIPYGVDTSRWRDTARDLDAETTPRILTVARLVERKNLDVAVDAVDALRSMLDTDVSYRLVGTGPLEDRFESDPRVASLGYVADIRRQYEWADVFFLPSKHEAFGMVFCEALANGLPVVTSTTGGQTDIVTDDVGARALSDDPDALARRLEFVLEYYDDLQPYTRPHAVDYYDRDRMVDDYTDLYRTLT